MGAGCSGHRRTRSSETALPVVLPSTGKSQNSGTTLATGSSKCTITDSQVGSSLSEQDSQAEILLSLQKTPSKNKQGKEKGSPGRKLFGIFKKKKRKEGEDEEVLEQDVRAKQEVSQMDASTQSVKEGDEDSLILQENESAVTILCEEGIVEEERKENSDQEKEKGLMDENKISELSVLFTKDPNNVMQSEEKVELKDGSLSSEERFVEAEGSEKEKSQEEDADMSDVPDLIDAEIIPSQTIDRDSAQPMQNEPDETRLNPDLEDEGCSSDFESMLTASSVVSVRFREELEAAFGEDKVFFPPKLQSQPNDWRTHMLNIQVVYNGQGLRPSEKDWLGSQFAGIVNILLSKGSIPENLSFVDEVVDRKVVKQEQAGLKLEDYQDLYEKGKIPTTNQRSESLNRSGISKKLGRMLQLEGDSDDGEEIDLSYDPFGLNELKMERREKRKTRTKFGSVIEELTQRLSQQSLKVSESSSSGHTFYSVQEEAFGECEFSPRPASRTQSPRVRIRVNEVRMRPPAEEEPKFHSKSEPFILVQQSKGESAVKKNINAVVGQTSSQKVTNFQQQMSQSASSPHFFRIERESPRSKPHTKIVYELSPCSSPEISAWTRKGEEKTNAGGYTSASPATKKIDNTQVKVTSPLLRSPDASMARTSSPKPRHSPKTRPQGQQRSRVQNVPLRQSVDEIPESRHHARNKWQQNNEELTAPTLAGTRRSPTRSQRSCLESPSTQSQNSNPCSPRYISDCPREREGVIAPKPMYSTKARPAYDSYKLLPESTHGNDTQSHHKVYQRRSSTPPVSPLEGKISPRPAVSSSSEGEKIEIPNLEKRVRQPKGKPVTNSLSPVLERANFKKSSSGHRKLQLKCPKRRGKGNECDGFKESRKGNIEVPSNSVPLMRTPVTRKGLKSPAFDLNEICANDAYLPEREVSFLRGHSNAGRMNRKKGADQVTSLVKAKKLLPEFDGDFNFENASVLNETELTSPLPNVSQPVKKPQSRNRRLACEFHQDWNSSERKEKPPGRARSETRPITKKQSRVTFNVNASEIPFRSACSETKQSVQQDDNPYADASNGEIKNSDNVQSFQPNNAFLPQSSGDTQRLRIPLFVGIQQQPNYMQSLVPNHAFQFSNTNQQQAWVSPLGIAPQQQQYVSPFVNSPRISVPGCFFPSTPPAVQNGYPAQSFGFASPQNLASVQTGALSPGQQLNQNTMNVCNSANHQRAFLNQANPTELAFPGFHALGIQSAPNTPRGQNEATFNSDSLGQQEKAKSDNRIWKEAESSTELSARGKQLTHSETSLEKTPQKSRKWRQCERERDDGEAWWMPQNWAKERGIGTFGRRWKFEKDELEKKEKELQIAKDANVEQIRMSRFIPW